MAYRSSAYENYVTSGTCTVPVPSGAAIGDIVVVDVWLEAASSVTSTPPTGFTVEASISTNTGLAATMRRYWKRLTAADTGSYAFTLSSNVPHMAMSSAWSGRVTSGSPFGTSGAATATYGGTGSGGGAVPGAVSAAAAAAGADAVLGISGYNTVTGVSASGFTAVTNSDAQWVLYASNVSSGAPGSVTPTGSADYYVEILSLLLPASGGSSFAAAGTVAATTAASLAVTSTHVAAGTVAAVSAASLAVTATHSVSGSVAATSAVSLSATGPGTSGTVAAVSAVALSVTATHVAAGTAAASSTTALAVTSTHVVAGTVAAVSAVHLAATGGANPYPATVDASGRYLVTGQGQPWPMWIDSQWDLFCWGGAHGEHGSTPADVFDGYATIQAANGFNAVIIMAINSDQDGEVGPYTNGRTWDGIAPWGAGGIGDLNEPYWARLDSLIAACGNHGITVYLELITSYTLGTGTAFAGLNTTNAATFGTAIGNRYKNTPNLIYCFGVDYFATAESAFAACLTAIRATGDTHLATVEYMAESSTRTTSSGGSTGSFASAVDFDDVYSYNAAALEVRRAYAKSPARPTQFVNGHYYQGSSDNKLMDDLTGWALTSGSKGMFYGSEATWQWGSGAYAALSTEGWPNNNLPATIGWFTALAKWHLLIPDTASAFITSSRGTDATAISSGGSGGEYNASSSQNNYLTGAVTADGTLGLIYTPTSRTITIDTSKLVAGFTAKWVDPKSGTATPTTAGSSYTHPGNNSGGHAGWYLLLEGQVTSGGTVTATSTVSLAVTVTHAVSGAVAATSAAALTVTATHAAAGTVAGDTSTTLAITATHTAAGVVAAVSGASLVIGAQQAAGTVEAVSAVALAVTATHSVSGTVAAVSTTALAVTVPGQLGGTVTAVSAVSLAVTATHAAAGQVDVTSGLSLAVTAIHQAAGTVAAHSTAALNLDPVNLRDIDPRFRILADRYRFRLDH